MAFQEMPAGQFKTHCLRLLDDVRQRRIPLVITKRRKAIAKLVPVEDAVVPSFDALKGTVMFHGDVIASIDEAWHADC